MCCRCAPDAQNAPSRFAARKYRLSKCYIDASRGRIERETYLNERGSRRRYVCNWILLLFDMAISDVFVFTDLRSWFLPGRFDLFGCAKKMLVEGIMFWVWRDDKLRFDYEKAFVLAGLLWNRGHVYHDLKLKSLTLLNEKKCNNCFNLTIPVVMKIAHRCAQQFSRQALRAGIAG